LKVGRGRTHLSFALRLAPVWNQSDGGDSRLEVKGCDGGGGEVMVVVVDAAQFGSSLLGTVKKNGGGNQVTALLVTVTLRVAMNGAHSSFCDKPELVSNLPGCHTALKGRMQLGQADWGA
jgi:hypothetical protein